MDLQSQIDILALERYEKILPFLYHGVPLAKAAHEAAVPVRTMWRWVQNYKKHGLSGLVRKQRFDSGSRRNVNADMQALIEGMLLTKPAPSIAALRRNLAKVCEKESWPLPSYGVIYDIARNLDPALITLALQGVKAYKDSYDLVYRREADRPNEFWQADHTQLDCLIADSSGKPRKPWLTIILDDFSRAIAGYIIGFESPSALGTALALRQAIWRKDDSRWHICGIPERFYTDHGSDFTSKHIEQVSASLKFELIFSTAGEPRGRGKIERFFLSVNQLFLCHQPGYAPVGHRNPPPGSCIDDLDHAFKSWLLSEYHSREHSETGSAPQHRWESSGFLPRLAETRDQLDLLLLTVAKSRKVHRDGVHFHGFRYVSPTLAGFVGDQITIRYDPRDLAEIVVYLPGGEYICKAISQELADQTVSLKSLVTARNARRRQLRTSISDRAAIVERYLQAHSPVPAISKQTVEKREENDRAEHIKRFECD